MANSTSTGTIPDVTTTLANFTDELNNILNGLQTQVNTDAANESAALTAFITAEEKLEAASTSFGGPSPSFVAPIWIMPSAKNSSKTSSSSSTPSKSMTGAKNYYTAFYPLIKKTLQIQTAKELEAAEALKRLEEDLRNIFRAQYYSQFSVNSDGESPKTAPTQTTLLDWVQDSVIMAGSELGIIYEKGIINILGAKIIANSALPTSGTTNFTAAWVWAYGIITDYYKNNNPGVNYDKKTKDILTLLHSTWGKYKANNEASMLEWIQATLTNASSTLGITNLQKEELIGVLEDEILKLFPQPDKSFFYENLQNLLFDFIYNPPANSSPQGSDAPAEFMLNIKSSKNATSTTNTDGEIQAQAIGGSGNYSYSLTGSPAKTQTPAWKAPLPNSSGTFGSLPPGIYKVSVNDGTTTEILPSPITVLITGNGLSVAIAAKPPTPTVPGGKNVTLTATLTPASAATDTVTYTWTNLDTGLQIIGASTDSVSNLGAGNYGVHVIETPKGANPAISTVYGSIQIKDPTATGATKKNGTSKANQITNRGVKYYLEQLRNAGPTISSDEISSLESNIQNIIKIGITNTFNQMAEYGSQGYLMSATYDCQIISRIADYTSALLNELKTDYDKLIPTTNKQALLAAQSITSAAVSIERFSIVLPEIRRAFDDEFNSDQVGSGGATLGSSYDQIKNYVESTSSTTAQNPISSLDGISNALYSGSGSHVSLVQEAELKGVTLASKAAGLNTSLSNLLTTEQAAALKALTSLKVTADSNLKNAIDAYTKTSLGYFSELDSYITAKQNWEYDQLKQNAVQSAMSTLNSVVMTGLSKSGNFTNNPYYKKPSSN